MFSIGLSEVQSKESKGVARSRHVALCSNQHVTLAMRTFATSSISSDFSARLLLLRLLTERLAVMNVLF